MLSQLPFSPLYDYYTTAPLTYDGHNYKEGEAFPKPDDTGKKPVVDHRLLRQLYEQRRISAVPPAKAPLPKEPPQPTEEPVDPDAPPVEKTTAPPAVDEGNRRLKIKFKGFSKWWIVDADTDDKLAGPYASAEEAHKFNPGVPLPKKD